MIIKHRQVDSNMSDLALCIVVPIYNHGKQLYKTISNLATFNLPIILVDDGSDTETKRVIAKVVDEFKQIKKCKTLDDNMGKGVAVTVGVNIAFHYDYTHIFQIDADGQHDFADIPKFIQEMKKHPKALISGMPIYDHTIPKSRLHGRKITNFWVTVETLTMKITESMCGFRIYPVIKYLEVSNRKNFASRMNFDIDIIVRMYWSGININYIKTKVIYPADGHSNFRMVKDNILITMTHITLVFGMLIRFPVLLWRKRK